MRVGRRRWLAIPLLALLLQSAADAHRAVSRTGRESGSLCSERRGDPAGATAGLVADAVRAGRDILGDRLIRAPEGPTYTGVARYLAPLMRAGHVPGHRSVPLTDSGVYYLPFAMPRAPTDPGPVALHLADGSEIVSGTTGGARLVLTVGVGNERFGACLARLSRPQLAGGYLPILRTRYVDASGRTYVQESFSTRIPQTSSLVSFVRLSVDARRVTEASPVILFTPSVRGLAARGNELLHDGASVLFFGAGGRFTGGSVRYVLPAGRLSVVYAAWVVRQGLSRTLTLDAAEYAQARRTVNDFWRRELARMPFLVPEPRVLDAERSLLIQNLEMGWRYSLGNGYQRLEYPESLDAVSVMGEYGYGELARATLDLSLRQRLALYPNWEMGVKLLSSAVYYRLFGDRAFLDSATPILQRYVSNLRAQVLRSRLSLLRQERWASDLPEVGYALDSQAVVWQGLAAMAQVWSEAGYSGAARASRKVSARLGDALRVGIRASQVHLPDGTLFVPIELYSHQQPYRAVTESRDGSYWNLTIPYALASGLIAPRSAQAGGVLAYLREHGSRLLGLVRFGTSSLSGEPGAVVAGTDDVYLLHTARFLADNDAADELVLSLYGQLAAGMTDTFVSGESTTLMPSPGDQYRSMYLPPNSASNAAFLETLRLTLVHEVVDREGRPYGLELASATPRAWLRPGAVIRVRGARTSFGPLSYRIATRQRSVRVTLTVPSGTPLGLLQLRLRLPDERPLRAVSLNGRHFSHFEARTETIDLSGQTGTLNVTASY